MIKNFVTKIKATKKIANEKNVHNWYNCVFHSVIIIMGISMILSLYTIVYLADMTLDTTIGELLINMQIGIFLPIAYSIILSYVFLEKLVILHILVFEKFNKQVFKMWQKLDMYWYKRYKKHSPITEGLSKLQSRVAKFQTRSKKQRRIVIIGIIVALLLVQVGFRAPLIIELLEEPKEIEVNIDEVEEQTQPKRPQITIRGAG